MVNITILLNSMIETIRGRLTAKFEDFVVLENGGFGLKIFLCRRDLLKMPKFGGFVKFYTHFSFRLKQQEIAPLIFGFLKEGDRDFFRELLKKDRIGVKIAFFVLNFASSTEIEAALRKGDIAFFDNCRGVPKKVIKNLFLEYGLIEGVKKSTTSLEDKKIIEALKKLGYLALEAKDAVARIPEKIRKTDQRLKEALKILNQ